MRIIESSSNDVSGKSVDSTQFLLKAPQIKSILYKTLQLYFFIYSLKF